MLLATHGVLSSVSSQEFDTTSFLFGGIDDYMETNSNYTMLDNSQFFSISVWVKVNDLTTPQRIVYLVGGRRLFLYVRNDGTVDASIRSSTYYIRSNAGAITVNNWAHIVWTYDGTQTRYNRYGLYVNGASNVGSNNGSTSSALQTFTTPLNVGLVSGRYLNGNVNELAFWDTTLTSTQALEIYNNGKANNLNNLPSGTANPNNWWRSENATFNGTNLEVPDTNGSFPITTSNMNSNNIVNVVP